MFDPWQPRIGPLEGHDLHKTRPRATSIVMLSPNLPLSYTYRLSSLLLPLGKKFVHWYGPHALLFYVF
jgi:hypothetical protein